MKSQCALGITADTLSDWRSHLLSPAEQQRLDAHVGGCAACQSIIAQHERIAQALRILPPRPTGAEVWNLLKVRIRSTRGDPMVPQRQRIPWNGLSAALAIVVLFVALFVFLDLHRTGGTISQTPTMTPIAPTATAVVSTATPQPSSTPAAGPAPSVAIDMFSTTAGWGLTSTPTHGRALVYTSDGGHTWENITPSDLAPSCCLLFVRTATDAWVAPWVGSSPGPTLLWHTTDGGKTWTRSTVNTGGFLSLFFLDANRGWLVSNPAGVTAGQQAILVWSTSNGGATWTQMTPQAIGGKYTTGISFANATTGFLSGTVASPQGSGVPLLVTHDGGASWQDAGLTIPASLQTTYDVYDAQPPVFWPGGNGIFFDTLADSSGFSFLSFRTTDGGAAWAAGPYITIKGSGAASANLSLPSSVTPAGDAFVATTDGNGNVALYTLTPGANAWSIVASSSPTRSLLRGIVALDMIDATTGWAISAGGLLITTDGGVSWSLLSAAS
jgi:photosystem II stability/assembly factor-like uncharacterized protein